MNCNRLPFEFPAFASLVCAVLSGASVGCAPTRGAASADTPENPIERYFPLRDGTIYQYATRSAAGTTGVLVVEVARADDRATLKSGLRTQRLEILPLAIRNEEGFYQLKMPLSVGNSWQGQVGEVHITRTDVAIQVEAGSYTQCVETEERTQATVQLRTTHAVYCPNVGLVSLEVEAKSAVAVDRESAKLRYFGPKIDINAL
jgi:hypothetical protein